MKQVIARSKNSFSLEELLTAQTFSSTEATILRGGSLGWLSRDLLVRGNDGSDYLDIKPVGASAGLTGIRLRTGGIIEIGNASSNSHALNLGTANGLYESLGSGKWRTGTNGIYSNLFRVGIGGDPAAHDLTSGRTAFDVAAGTVYSSTASNSAAYFGLNTFWNGSANIRKQLGVSQLLALSGNGTFSHYTSVSGAGGSTISYIETLRCSTEGSQFFHVLTVPNATADGHAMNRTSSDARYIKLNGDVNTLVDTSLKLKRSTSGNIIELYSNILTPGTHNPTLSVSGTEINAYFYPDGIEGISNRLRITDSILSFRRNDLNGIYIRVPISDTENTEDWRHDTYVILNAPAGSTSIVLSCARLSTFSKSIRAESFQTLSVADSAIANDVLAYYFDSSNRPKVKINGSAFNILSNAQINTISIGNCTGGAIDFGTNRHYQAFILTDRLIVNALSFVLGGASGSAQFDLCIGEWTGSGNFNILRSTGLTNCFSAGHLVRNITSIVLEPGIYVCGLVRVGGSSSDLIFHNAGVPGTFITFSTGTGAFGASETGSRTGSNRGFCINLLNV